MTGWASLRPHGGNFFDGLAPDGRTRLPVPLAVGQRGAIRGDSRADVSREPLHPDEVVTVQGIPCTVVSRAVFDEMRRADGVVEAVVAIDMAVAALLISVRRVRAYAADRRRWRRSTLVQRALDLASERSRSPNESRTRIIWEVDAGLPRPMVNQQVWDLRGNLLAIADLLDVEAGLVGEFDGADHRAARMHTSDIERQERFERHLLEVFRVTGLDVLHPGRVVDRIVFHRSRARWFPPAERRWTIEPPRGWEVEQSMDDLLDERDFLHALHAEFERNPPDLKEVRGW